MSGVTTWLEFTPLDTILVRDGRAVDGGVSAVSATAAPLPSTMGGAVRTALGTDVGGHLVGPLVAIRAGGDSDSMIRPAFPIPRDLVSDDGAVYRSAPVPIRDDEKTDLPPSVTHLLHGRGDPLDGLCDITAMDEWLCGTDLLAAGGSVDGAWWQARSDIHPWHVEARAGLALRWDGELQGTAEPGMLYASAHLRPHEGTRLLVGCVAAEPIPVRREVVPLGGRGRQAAVAMVAAPALPTRPEDFPGGRVAVYLATPALMDDPYWCPPQAKLCAVALSGPQPVATASQRRGLWQSRQLNWAVPAGTVYYLDFGTPDAARVWAANHHGGLLPGQTAGLRLVTAGFGLCFTGRW